MIKNIKYDIYQRLGALFPSIFKARTFSRLKNALDPKSSEKPSESELYILHLFAGKDSVIVDVGANNGLYCYYFRELLQCREVYAFEPIPALNAKLRKWFRDIHVYPYAISNVNETKTLKIPYINSVKYDTRAKLDNELVEAGENRYDELKIEARTLDAVIPANAKPDFIKIDIEGHERSAVEGASELISKYHPVLMIEIEARHHGTQFQPFIESVIARGYQCVFFDRSRNELLPFADFSVEKHQDQKGSMYINNFLFLPERFSVDMLNASIKQLFNS